MLALLQLVLMKVHDGHAGKSEFLHHFCLSSFEKAFNANLMRLGFICSWVPGRVLKDIEHLRSFLIPKED